MPIDDRISSSSELVLTSHHDVRAVLSDPEFVVPSVEAGAELATLDWLRATVSRFANGAAHARRRAAAVARLEELDAAGLARQARQQTRETVLESAGRPFDVIACLARRVPVGVLAARLGVSAGASERAVDAVAAISAAYHPSASPAARAAADPAVEDLVGLLGPGEQEDIAQRIGLLVQACDATAGLIGNALHGALRAPADARSRWTIDGLLSETLRHDPPVRSTRRLARRDRRPGGRLVPAGSVVLLDLAAANRDPEVFYEPDRFDPGRADADAHLTFGAGRRSCPGVRHARALAAGVVVPVLATCSLHEHGVEHEAVSHLRVPARLLVISR